MITWLLRIICALLATALLRLIYGIVSTTIQHRHTERARYDSAGSINCSTLVINDTHRPEPVLTAAQWGAMRANRPPSIWD